VPGPWIRSLLAASLALGGFAGEEARAARFAGGRIDHFESEMTVVLEVPGLGTQDVELRGPTTVLVGERREEGGRGVVDTEIVAMDLAGEFQSQTLRLRANPRRSSVGEVRAQGATDDFPADSFFDVFVEVDVPGIGLLENLVPVRVQAANLQKLPPLFDTYTHPPPEIPLVLASDPGGRAIATIQGESSHRPIQDPTFGLAAGGSLDASQLYGLPKPPAVELSRAGLGLQAGDDVDALSYGADGLDAPGRTTLVFSVDPASVGAPNTGVNQQAVLGSQEGAEYVTFVDDTNRVLVPPDLVVPLPQTDDLDALVDDPAAVVDFDDDGQPERAVFFSLAPGSPTLGALGASAADVLVSAGGAVSVFAPAAAIGLQPGDNLDAMCLMKAGLPQSTLRPGSSAPTVPPPGPLLFDAMVFSLAPGSPTLAAQGHAASDLFFTNFANARPGLAGTPLTLYADAAQLGLLAGDDLDALKCARPVVLFELDGRGDLDGPGNGTGCAPNAQVDAALQLDLGPQDVVVDPTVPPSDTVGTPNFWELWSIQNPAVGDRHGPYAHPGTNAAAAGLRALDPLLDVSFVGGPGDNCGLPHVHASPFGFPGDRFGLHADPDVFACGHGVFVPHPFPIFVIPTRRDVPTTAEFVAAYYYALLRAPALLPWVLRAAWHLYDGPSTVLDLSDCPPAGRRVLLIFSGLAITQANLAYLPFALFGGAGGGAVGDGGALAPAMRIGPAQRAVAPPLYVPEAAGCAPALAAVAALGALARRRSRHASRRPAAASGSRAIQRISV
jgi:hypothetical protein